MDGSDNDGVQEPHQDVQDRGKNESFNSIGHEDYHLILIGEWNFPCFFIGHKDSHLTFHR
jgi:hypothetical protein